MSVVIIRPRLSTFGRGLNENGIYFASWRVWNLARSVNTVFYLRVQKYFGGWPIHSITNVTWHAQMVLSKSTRLCFIFLSRKRSFRKSVGKFAMSITNLERPRVSESATPPKSAIEITEGYERRKQKAIFQSIIFNSKVKIAKRLCRRTC